MFKHIATQVRLPVGATKKYDPPITPLEFHQALYGRSNLYNLLEESICYEMRCAQLLEEVKKVIRSPDQGSQKISVICNQLGPRFTQLSVDALTAVTAHATLKDTPRVRVKKTQAAYGSALDLAKLQKRIPSIRFFRLDTYKSLPHPTPAFLSGFRDYPPEKQISAANLKRYLAKVLFEFTKVKESVGTNYDPEKEIALTYGENTGISTVLECFFEINRGPIAVPAQLDPKLKLILYSLNQRFSRESSNDTLYQYKQEDGQAVPVLDFNSIKKAIVEKGTKLVVINSPHFPTGCRLGENEWKELAQLSVKHEIMIIVIADLEFLKFEQSTSPLTAFKICPENLIFLSSLTKTSGFSEENLGFIVGSHQWIPVFENRIKSQFDPQLSQGNAKLRTAIMQSWRKPTEWKQTYDQMAESAEAMIEVLTELPGVGVYKPNVSTVLMVEVSGLLNAKKCDDLLTLRKRLLDEAGIACLPGNFFNCKTHIALSLAHPKELLVEAAKAFAHWVKEDQSRPSYWLLSK